MPTNYWKCLVIVLVILVLIVCDGGNVKVKKRKLRNGGWKGSHIGGKGNEKAFKNDTSKEQGRGFASSIFGGRTPPSGSRWGPAEAREFYCSCSRLSLATHTLAIVRCVRIGILSFGRVFNFFPVGGERECRPSTDTVARAGICLNPYDCHQREGKASGDCAHGLGVCCVFEVTCGAVVENNLTYFMSPGFPEPWSEEKDCDITIHKTHAGIMQLRIDFIQFTIGQPNRRTGECDEDAMILGEGANNFTLCGQNYGQHLYYTLSTGSEKREAGELSGTKSTRLSIRMRGTEMPRIWLLRLAQMPLAYSAPHNCLQYYTENNGTVKTFNFAYNGRHLSGHEYRACIRKNTGFCSVRYTPCDYRSFRIGPGTDRTAVLDPNATVELLLGPGESGGAGTGFNGTDGAFVGVVTTTSTPPESTTPTGPAAIETSDQVAEETEINESPAMEQVMMEEGMMPADGAGTQEDEMEGSGADPNIATPIAPARPASPGMLSRIWSFMFPSWLWGQRAFRSSGRGQHSNSGRDSSDNAWENYNSGIDSSEEYDSRGWSNSEDASKNWKWMRWSPYAQHYTQEDDKIRYYGYGKYGVGLKGFGRQRCRDRITIPCENEYFVSSTSYVPGVCDPHHCGGNFCPGVHPDQCRVETSISPFAVSVHFGPPTSKRSPEDNLGACLRYSLLPCDS